MTTEQRIAELKARVRALEAQRDALLAEQARLRAARLREARRKSQQGLRAGRERGEGEG